jgi:hypothetical protein
MKLSLCLISEALSHEHLCESGGIFLSFLIESLDETEWSALGPGRFIHGETTPGTQLIGWVHPKNSLGAVR